MSKGFWEAEPARDDFQRGQTAKAREGRRVQSLPSIEGTGPDLGLNEEMLSRFYRSAQAFQSGITGTLSAGGSGQESASKSSMRNRGATKPDEAIDACLFCRIIAREMSAHIVFEDSASLAFLDHRPLFPGHCLLVTKKHYATLYDLPAEQIGPIFSNAQMLAQAVQRAMQANGSFVAMNNIVSQSVPHFHIHVVPRKRGDGLRGFFWPRHKTTEEESAAVQQRIVAVLNDSH